ncbi:MAG: ketopantoate reductase family protein [Microthrixaceae bacterium]
MARIAVVGCGAMGSVYAARLTAAGKDVLVVDRWAEHVRAIRQHGLVVSGPDGEIVARVRAYESVPDEQVDLVILAVKAAGVAAAAANLAPLLGEQTVVLTIQNGLGTAQEVADRVGADRLAVGIASGFGASRPAPGRARHDAMRAVRFGSFDGLGSGHLEASRSDPPRLAAARLQVVAELWRQAGFDAEVVRDLVAMQWEKLICNVAYSAPCALSGLTVGEVLDHDDLGPVSRAAATEAFETALALGVDLDVEDPEALVREFAGRMPAAKPSALLDHEAGRVSEISFINGAVPREAAKVGRTAPVNATLTALVRERETRFADQPSRPT